MHVALVSVTIDPNEADSSSETLTNEILPMIKAAPGFVAGYWLEPADGKGFSMVFFDTEEQARLTAPPVGSKPATGVTIDTIEFRAVAANI